MNCREGELAVIVRSAFFPECIGKIVCCVKFEPAPDGAAAWLVDRRVHEQVIAGGSLRRGDWWYDIALRPIRDNDGEDETLTWACKPQQVEA